tara:strand:+ start:1492 stop:1755 length:264 start_codon:yes stop_codon:yes gene_type:complete
MNITANRPLGAEEKEHLEGVAAMLSEGQVYFIIDECMKSLSFGDYFDAYSTNEDISSETTQYLVHVITLLNKMVKAKEHINFVEGKS